LSFAGSLIADLELPAATGDVGGEKGEEDCERIDISQGHSFTFDTSSIVPNLRVVKEHINSTTKINLSTINAN
jgi:hypothetical protein